MHTLRCIEHIHARACTHGEFSFDPLSLLLTLLSFLFLSIYPLFMKTTTLFDHHSRCSLFFFQVLSFTQLFICYTYSWSCSQMYSVFFVVLFREDVNVCEREKLTIILFVRLSILRIHYCVK